MSIAPCWAFTTDLRLFKGSLGLGVFIFSGVIIGFNNSLGNWYSSKLLKKFFNFLKEVFLIIFLISNLLVLPEPSKRFHFIF